MTNPIGQVPRLLELTTSFFINHQDLYHVDERARDGLNSVMKNVWNDLKKFEFLKEAASEIEKQMIQSQQVCLNDRPDQILEKNVDLLFKNLAKKFHIPDGKIPVDASSHLCLRHALLVDESLQTVWGKIFYKFTFMNHQPVSLDEIKQWMENVENVEQINDVNILDLSEAGLKTIPYQLTKFSNSRSIYLQDNEIKCIPEFFTHFSKLEILSLNNTGIKEAPEFLGNFLNLRILFFNENNIKNLPVSIGNLSELRSLYLNENEIEILPESLGRLSKLQCLSLGQNKIRTLPQSLGNLRELQTFYLHDNQIETLPESLRNLSKLFTFTLCRNPIRNLPEFLEPIRKAVIFDVQEMVYSGNHEDIF